MVVIKKGVIIDFRLAKSFLPGWEQILINNGRVVDGAGVILSTPYDVRVALNQGEVDFYCDTGRPSMQFITELKKLNIVSSEA